jgi:hypothetical protein
MILSKTYGYKKRCFIRCSLFQCLYGDYLAIVLQRPCGFYLWQGVEALFKLLVARFTSALLSKRREGTSGKPTEAAMCKGVHPSFII